MGRKKQKVRWTTVEDGFFGDSGCDSQQQTLLKTTTSPTQTQDFDPEFTQVPPPTSVTGMPQRHNSDSSVTSSHNGGGQNGQQQNGQQYMRYRSKYPPRRPYWSNTPVPPRFERSNAKHYPDIDQDSSCETEELPNGFTKIRSKNLDVLFRKDYYAQRQLSAATTSSSAVSSEQGEPPEDPDSILATSGSQLPVPSSTSEQPVVPEEEEEDEEDVIENVEKSEKTEHIQTKQKTEKDVTETIVTKKPTSTSVINSNATPFYPASYVPVPPQHPPAMPPSVPPSNYITTPPVSSQGPHQGVAVGAPPPGVPSPHPNLFLYSPSSNTMIPCEEIIIPNAVVPGQDVYQGPSNIYLAFPMENNGTHPGGVPVPTGAPTASCTTSGGSNSTVGAAVQTSCGNSTNSTPPQAQSPQTSSSATAFATTSPPMVQYDQYGVPYTSYTPMMTSEGGSAIESSSIESTTPNSPPDLSMYNPTNWVPAPPPASAGTAADPAYQQAYQHQQYYSYYQTPYYNNYAVMMENSTVPSSGESPNEDRSEGEDPASTPNTATTTSSPKKESEKESEKIIPGLVLNAKRPTKKRRKKKTNTEPVLVGPSTSDQNIHRGSSSSEANVLHMAASKAITILKREESETEVESSESIKEDITETASNLQDISPAVMEPMQSQQLHSQPPKEVQTATIVATSSPPNEINVKNSIATTASENPIKMEESLKSTTTSQLSVEVKEEGDEEVLVVVSSNEHVVGTIQDFHEKSIVQTPEPETEAAPAPPPSAGGAISVNNNNRVRPNRRRRGARKNDKNRKFPEDEVTKTRSSEWEDIPKEITNPDLDGGWETTKSRKSRSKIPQSLCYTPQDLSRDQSSEIHIIPEDEAEEIDNSIIDQTGTGNSEVIPVVNTKKSHEMDEIISSNNEVEKTAAEQPETEATAAGENDDLTKISENCATTKTIETGNAELETVMEVTEGSPTVTTSTNNIELNSAPASRKSTLKRSKKKRSSLDGTGNNPGQSNNSGNGNSVLSRPVLISDGDYDVASAAAALRVQKNAFDVLDQDKLQELKKITSGNGSTAGAASMDTLYVSDIGYGMLSGPIGLGRFGLGKYIPPNRTEEIYPIPMQTKENEDACSSENETGASSIAADLEMTGAAASCSAITGNNSKSAGNLKTMLEEVLRSGGASCNSTVEGMSSSVAKNSLTTYIRDAARFTELTSSVHPEENCSTSAVAAAAATIPIPTSENMKFRETTTQQILKKKEDDDLDLD